MDIAIAILATYAITTMVSDTDGMFGLFYKLRRVKQLDMLNCFICLSVYISALLALYTANTPLEWLVHTFAISGGAILINRWEQ